MGDGVNVGVIGGEIVEGVPGGVERDKDETSDGESPDVGD